MSQNTAAAQTDCLQALTAAATEGIMDRRLHHPQFPPRMATATGTPRFYTFALDRGVGSNHRPSNPTTDPYLFLLSGITGADG